MRIGLVSCEYPPQQGLGGVGTYMFRLAGALGVAGHEVHVVAGPSDHPPIPQPNVHLHRIDVPETPPFAVTPNWLLRGRASRLMKWCHPVVWHWIKWDLASYEAIRQLDREHPLDVVEAPEHAANGWMAGRIHRWPLVVRFHCPWEMFVRINGLPTNPMHWLLSHLERWTVAHCPDAITVPSRAMLQEVERSWRLARTPLVIPNFMDVPEAPADLPDESAPQRIVCHGRIEPLKGQDTLVKAFALLAYKHPRAQLWLVGPDRSARRSRLSEQLPLLVPDQAVRSRIFMPGAVPLAQIHEHLRAARVCVVPSVGFESFSFSALEAMSAARPTVVARTGALPELIDHETTGLTFPPGNPGELAAAIDRLLADRSFSLSCAQAAHAKARQCYDTRRVLPQMIESYEQAATCYYKQPLQLSAPSMPEAAA